MRQLVWNRLYTACLIPQVSRRSPSAPWYLTSIDDHKQILPNRHSGVAFMASLPRTTVMTSKVLTNDLVAWSPWLGFWWKPLHYPQTKSAGLLAHWVGVDMHGGQKGSLKNFLTNHFWKRCSHLLSRRRIFTPEKKQSNKDGSLKAGFVESVWKRLCWTLSKSFFQIH